MCKLNPHVADAQWERIREHFTQKEKETLRSAVVGQVICPKGVVVDLTKLPGDLGAKLSKLLVEL